MYEFLFDKVASLDANQLHENIIFMEATLKKEIEKNRDNLSQSSIEYFERVIQYIKSGVNVTLNLNELNAEDIDLIIQKKEKRRLQNILDTDGVEKFLEIENDVICESFFRNAVIATGGSAVYGKEAMAKLKAEAIIIYLKVEPDVLEKRIDNIHTRGIAMKDGTTINELYAERAPLYEKYAEITVECGKLTAEECVDEITRKLKV